MNRIYISKYHSNWKKMKTSERERLPFWFVEIRSNRKKERKKERGSASSSFLLLLLLRHSDNANFIWEALRLSSYDHPTLGPMPAGLLLHIPYTWPRPKYYIITHIFNSTQLKPTFIYLFLCGESSHVLLIQN